MRISPKTLSRERKIALICSGVALWAAWVAIFPTLRANSGRPSALVHIASDEPLASLAIAADPDFVLVPSYAHYDGAYFYAIALDPVARGNAHDLIDEATYRYTRPLLGWLAGLVSLGQPRGIPIALLGLNLAAFAASSWLISVLAVRLGASPWSGLLVPLSPGLLIALTLDTHEPLALCAVAIAVLAWLDSRRCLTLLCFIIAAFTREYGVLLALGLAAHEILAEPGGILERIRRAVPLLVGPVVYAGWWLYLLLTFGRWPLFGPGNVGLPAIGWFASITAVVGLQTYSFDEWQIGVAMVGIDVALFTGLAAALHRSLTVATRLRWVVAPLLIVSLSLNWWLLLYPKEALRVLAIPIIFGALTWIAPLQRRSAFR